jgi:hypothetical protein
MTGTSNMHTVLQKLQYLKISHCFTMKLSVLLRYHFVCCKYIGHNKSHEHYYHKTEAVAHVIKHLVSEHILSLFYRIIHAFIAALHKPKDSAAVEVCFHTSQPATHSFLDCIIILILLACHAIFQDPKYVIF